MVINKNQEIAIKKCINILNGWLCTNDINSPSHYNIIDEYILDLEDPRGEILGEQITGLLNIIKCFK